jgi:hypothetical protein
MCAKIIVFWRNVKATLMTSEFTFCHYFSSLLGKKRSKSSIISKSQCFNFFGFLLRFIFSIKYWIYNLYYAIIIKIDRDYSTLTRIWHTTRKKVSFIKFVYLPRIYIFANFLLYLPIFTPSQKLLNYTNFHPLPRKCFFIPLIPIFTPSQKLLNYTNCWVIFLILMLTSYNLNRYIIYINVACFLIIDI